MFNEFSNLAEVTNSLHPIYIDQVKHAISQAGPLLGVLEIKAFFQVLESPPAPSPVGAHLVSLSFKTWRDISRHLNQVKRQYVKLLGRKGYNVWSKNISKLCSDRNILFAYTVPLFAENQMNSMTNSPSPAQDVFLSLLRPIIESDAKIIHDGKSQFSQKTPNASISVFLHAGQVPFTMTCHDNVTINRWQNHLEAATALLLPQVILDSEDRLPAHAKKIMRTAIEEEIRSWQSRRPTVGDVRNWDWMPKLI